MAELELEDIHQLHNDAQNANQDRFEGVSEENSWAMKEAMDNMSRGITDPTNPQREQIISYPRQKKRSRTVRPLEDEDVGLVGFDE